MNKKPVGHVIKSLINEKNLSAEQVAKLIGKSKAQVYNDYNRVGMKDDEIERYANGLKVDKKLIYDLMESGADNNAHSPTYLADHLQALEDKFAAITEQLQNQLAVKDRQIERLLDLLGKLNLGGKTAWEISLPLPAKEAA
jgi:hypothetical protein